MLGKWNRVVYHAAAIHCWILIRISKLLINLTLHTLRVLRYLLGVWVWRLIVLRRLLIALLTVLISAALLVILFIANQCDVIDAASRVSFAVMLTCAMLTSDGHLLPLGKILL